MKISFNPNIIGKPEKREDGYYYVDGKRVSLGYNFINTDETWEAIFNFITEDGITIAPHLKDDDHSRSESNFDEHSIAMVDIDNGMTIEQLFDTPYYEQYGAGFYTTPSHTDDNPRFRIIHRLEQPITRSETMRKVYRALMAVYGYADPSCKDAARLFFGTPNCVIKECRGNLLTIDAVNNLVKYIDAYDDQQVIQYNQQTTYQPLSDARKKQIIDLLQKSFVGQYEVWRNIGWGLREGGFSLTDFQFVTAGMMNQKTPKDAENVWNNYKSLNGKQPTMGTVIHFLKTRFGEDALMVNRHKSVSQKITNIQEKITKIKEELNGN